MKMLIETQEISLVWIINNSWLTVFLLIFSFDRSLLKNQTYFRKAECKHYFIPLLWVLSGAMLPLLFIFSFSFRKEECFLFVNRCKVLACAKMPGIWPPHMLAGHGLHLKQEKCRELGQWILGSNWKIKKKSQTLQKDKDCNDNKGKDGIRAKLCRGKEAIFFFPGTSIAVHFFIVYSKFIFYYNKSIAVELFDENSSKNKTTQWCCTLTLPFLFIPSVHIV